MSSFGSASCSRPSHQHRSWPLVRLVTCALACAVVAGTTPSAVAEIVYTMTDAPTIQNGWTLSGTITVTGTGSGLSDADISSYTYTVTKGSSSSTYSSSDGGYVNTRGLLATATELIVPYWQDPVSSYLQLFTPYGERGEAQLRWGTDDGEFSAAYWAYDGFWSESDPSYPLNGPEGWVIGAVTSAVPEIDPAGFGPVIRWSAVPSQCSSGGGGTAQVSPSALFSLTPVQHIGGMTDLVTRDSREPVLTTV